MNETYSQKIKSFFKDNHIIICSNRGPFSFFRENGKLKLKRGGGGLVSALLSLKGLEFTWIATAQSEEEREIGLNGYKVGSINLKFVDVPEDEYHRFYNKICNHILWFTQHGLWNKAYEPLFNLDLYSDWQCYQKANKRFAKAISSEIKNDKTTYLMIQDYHFYLLPQYLRKVKNNLVINHFVHIPWPSVFSWDILPDFIIRGITKSLLDADIVAFHCQQYSENFFSTVSRFTGLKGNFEEMSFFKNNKTKIYNFPISIDEAEIKNEIKNEKFNSYTENINASSSDKLIVRVDRADLSKNIIRGFLAFEQLLEKRQDLLGKVTFKAMLYQTRTGLKEYKKYLDDISKTVSRINKRFENFGWEPIDLRIADNYLESLAALREYDVLLVNPVADGMNLVAKEGPLINSKDGALILSKLCGAHNELGGFCLSINPYDIAQTASALEQALFEKKEKKQLKSSILKTIIRNNDSKKWIYYNIKAMEEVKVDKKKPSFSARY